MKLSQILYISVLTLSFPALSQAYLRLKFHHWFPKYSTYWTAATTQCQPQLTNYRYHVHTPECTTPCACAADCLLANVTGTMSSNMASGTLLLGLLPPILAQFGPTTAEVAVLSTYKPALALLLPLGSPAIHVSRLYRQIDVREPFSGTGSGAVYFDWMARWIRGRDIWERRVVDLLAYVAAVGAIANSVRTSIYLDLRSISGWRCGVLFLPLAWSLLGFGVQIFGIVAIRQRTYNPSSSPEKLHIWMRPFVSDLYRDVKGSETTIVSECLLWSASLVTIAHMVFGVLVLSALIFVDALAAFELFVLYATSAVVCQFILCLKLAEMRLECRNIAK